MTDEPKQNITIDLGGDSPPSPNLVPVPYAYGCCPRCGYRGVMR